MKNSKLRVAIVLALVSWTSLTSAQLNGTLNKAKDKAKEKVNEKKTESKIETPKPMETAQEIIFERPYQAVDYTSPNVVNLSDLLKDNDKLNPFLHIRKTGETGTMHFAKDYTELQGAIEPFVDDLKFEFFDAQPSSGIETFGSSFTSQQHIYVRITATTGTIIDVFHLDENNPVLHVRMNLYDDVSNKIRYTNEFMNTLLLTKEEANLKTLDIEILPHTMKYYPYGNKDQFYLSPFPNMHDQTNFPRTGKYHVGFFLYSQLKDDWGNALSGEGFTHGQTFEYDFAPKDVAAIKSDQDAVFQAKKRGFQFENKPLPKEWTEKSSAFTMGYNAKQISDLYVNSYDGGAEVLTVVKCFAHPSNGGWTIQYNDFGIPLYRYSNQFYTLFVKNKEGSCYFQRFSLRQQYNGGGTYDAVFGDITYEVNFTKCEDMK